jgi:large subunit ribosomal protein L9
VEVVLREDVDHVGLRGDVVNVARGYARNYLLPRGLAEVATPGLKRELERREALKARNEAKTTGEAEEIAKRLESKELKFEVNAGPTGSLFGSVTATNIVDRLWEEQKIRLDRRKLGVQTIKRIGRYTVEAEVFADVTAELRILVVPEGGELPPDEPAVTEAPAEAAAEAPTVVEAPAEPVPADEPAELAQAAEVEVEEDQAVEAAPEGSADVAPEQEAAEPEAAEPEAAEPEASEPEAAEPEAAAPEVVGEEPAEAAEATEPAAEDASPATGDETA